MDTDSAPIPIERLLAETAWVRAVAGSLVRDDAAADDVVQETYRAALRSPPRAGVPIRAWLRTVVRNFARKSHREKTRRVRREQAVAAPEEGPLPRPDELAERLESQRAVARLVAGLDDPFRSTVLLRYWEGLSSAEIARRQGTPPGTVRWRLKKALDELRARLDAEHAGDRNAWVALLLPIAGPRSAPASTAVAPAGAVVAAGMGGALVVKKSVIAALALVLVALGLHFAGAFDARPRAIEPDPPHAPSASGQPIVTDGGHTDSVPSGGGPFGSSPDPSVEDSPEDAGQASVRARFVDSEGRPIEGVTVQPDGVRPAVLSDVDGVVVVRIPMESAETWTRLEVRATGHVSRELTTVVRRGETSPLGDVVLEPGGVVSGTVFGPDGRTASGASVRLAKPPGPLDQVPPAPVDGPVTDHSTVTGPDGEFRIEGVPIGFWRVWAGGDGLRWTATEPVEVRADREVEGVTLRPEASERHDGFEVVVKDPEGRPVPNAPISYRLRTEAGRFLAGGTTHADENGRMRFRQATAAAGDFTARDPEERYGEARTEDRRAGSGEIVLRLTAGRRVAVLAVGPDDEPLGEFFVTFLEADRESVIRHAKGTGGRADVVPPSHPFRLRVEADAHGSETVGPWTPENAPPEIRVALQRIPGIRGRVTADGRPLAGARVVAHLVADPAWHQAHNGFIVTIHARTVASAVTEEDGTFALYPKRPGRLLARVEAEGLAPAESAGFDYEPEQGVTGLEIAVGRGGVIEGRVIDPSGGDPSGTIVGISRGDTYGRTVRVGEDGAYRFEHLTPGPFEVVIREEEIHPGKSSTFAGGPAKPIPFNCRVVEGETTVFDLRLPGAPATLDGRILLDGEAPRAWKAGLHPPGNPLVSETETDVGADGGFRLRAAEGAWQLLVTSPGGTHVSTVVAADIRIAGESRWECAFRTGKLEFARPADLDRTVQLYHRFETKEGVLVLTPVNAGDEEIRVPVGKGEIVRFDLAVWQKPRLWPRVAEVEVAAGR